MHKTLHARETRRESSRQGHGDARRRVDGGARTGRGVTGNTGRRTRVRSRGTISPQGTLLKVSAGEGSEARRTLVDRNVKRPTPSDGVALFSLRTARRSLNDGSLRGGQPNRDRGPFLYAVSRFESIQQRFRARARLTEMLRRFLQSPCGQSPRLRCYLAWR